MARLAGGNGIGRVDHLRAHYDEALAALASERNALQKERGQLVQARGPRFRVRARLRASSMCPGRAWAAGARARLRSRACMPVHAVMECPTISGWATAGSKGARAAATVQGSASLGSGAANLVTCPWRAVPRHRRPCMARAMYMRESLMCHSTAQPLTAVPRGPLV